MHIRKDFSIGFSILMIFTILFFFIILTPVFFVVGNPDQEYTYYGDVPAKIYRYRLIDEDDRNSGWQLINTTVSTTALLTIVAARDDTNIKVYNLTTDELVSEGQLSNMERHFVTLANGSIFKAVSDKPVSVLLLNYPGPPNASTVEGPLPHTFYTTIDGLFVGKEFVFMASEQTGQDYTMLALEKAEVTITRDDGDEKRYSLETNSHMNIMLRPFRVYKIESTGNIMVQSGVILERTDSPIICFPVPCAEGGFVGKAFYTKSVKNWDFRRDYGYRISAIEDTKVTVYDLVTKEVIRELSVYGGGGVGFMPEADAIALQSDKPITLSMIHNGSIEQTHPYAGGTGGIYSGYGIGVNYIGVRPNQDTMIFLPVYSNVEAYFFASEDTQITIDGVSRTIAADSYFLFTQPGTHRVTSDKNLVVQLNHWPLEPENQGLQFSGTLVPCIQTVDIIPDITLTPLGVGFPMTYLIIGVVAAVVAAVAGFFVISRARKPR